MCTYTCVCVPVFGEEEKKERNTDHFTVSKHKIETYSDMPIVMHKCRTV